ncbi:MAG: FMN-binding protein [Gemmatimonadetes bacterium]|nr:FMN-binding protein [Gemmatimonadota bacterium]
MSEQELPMAGDAQEPSGNAAGEGPPPAPRQIEASSVRLVTTLSVAGALAGMAIVVAFQYTKPRIDANAARELAAAVTEVLGGAKTYKTIYLEDGKFTAEPRDTAGLDKVYVGYDPNGQPVGVAMEAAEPGFQDIIDLIFGYDPAKGDVIGMKVLHNLETPGLGARIATDSSFVDQFNDVSTPLIGVKEGQGKGGHNEVVMITGSTISSRAVIKIINDRLTAIQKPVDAYWSTIAGTSSTGQQSATTSAGRTTSTSVAPVAAGAVPSPGGGEL